VQHAFRAIIAHAGQDNPHAMFGKYFASDSNKKLAEVAARDKVIVGGRWMVPSGFNSR